MFNKFMNWLVPKLEDWCERTGRMRVIMNNSESEDVYLIRYFLFYSKYFSIYIHRFMMSDLSVPHDHPFSFFGYIVSGEYEEETLPLPLPVAKLMRESSYVEIEGEKHYGKQSVRKKRKQGSWAYRPKEYSHVVRVEKQCLLENKKNAPLTIIFRGPYQKNWGFWEEDGPYRKWTYHKTYLNEIPTLQTKPQDSDIEKKA